MERIDWKNWLKFAEKVRKSEKNEKFATLLKQFRNKLFLSKSNISLKVYECLIINSFWNWEIEVRNPLFTGSLPNHEQKKKWIVIAFTLHIFIDFSIICRSLNIWFHFFKKKKFIIFHLFIIFTNIEQKC